MANYYKKYLKYKMKYLSLKDLTGGAPCPKYKQLKINKPELYESTKMSYNYFMKEDELKEVFKTISLEDNDINNMKRLVILEKLDELKEAHKEIPPMPPAAPPAAPMPPPAAPMPPAAQLPPAARP